MNFTHLLYFQKAVQYRSINKAAKELFITPSGLSMALNHLEKELGYQLFTRSNTGLSLTVEGEEFAADVETILKLREKWDETSNRILMPQKTTLKIAVIPLIFNSVFGALVSHLATKESGLYIAACEHTCREINSALLNHQMQYAILSYNETDRKSIKIMANNLGLEFEPLLRDDYAVYVSAKNPLYEKTHCSRSDLLPFTGVSMGHDSINQFDSQRFFDLQNTLYFHNQFFLLQKIIESDYFSILPQLLQQHPFCQSGQIHALHFDEEITAIEYGFFHPKQSDCNQAEWNFVEAVQNYFSAITCTNI